MDRVKVYDEICELLREKAEKAHIVDLEKYFSPNQDKSPYYYLASSLQNGTSSGMDRSIKFNGENEKIICSLLMDLDPQQIKEKYHDSWKELYDSFASKLPDSGADLRRERVAKEKDEKKRKRIEGKETNWEKYVHGLWDGAGFLTSAKGQHLLQSLTQYTGDAEFDRKWVKESLKEVQKIHGLGFALTCDWLKECGCVWLAKPDVHIKKVYVAMRKAETGITLNENKIDDVDIIKYYYDWAKELRAYGRDVSAYRLDKIIWLICTGDFYLDKNSEIGRDTIIKSILLIQNDM